MSAGTASMQHNDITRELLARLARLQAPADARVLSLYLDLDPSENLALPSARRTAINALIDQAKRAEGGLASHRARAWLREEVERVRNLLVRGVVDGNVAERARGLAVLACAPAELCEVVRLPRPVRSRAVVAPQPVIQPLAEIGPPRRWAALVTDGDDARLFEGCGEELVEVGSFRDQHRRRHRRGVWAPEREDGPLGTDERRHVRRAVEELVKRDRERGYELVVIGASEPVWSEVRRAAPDGMLARLAGRFNADVENASPGEVQRRAGPLLAAADTERERRLLNLLDERGVQGLEATVELVFERRVETLLLRPGLERAGALCPCCGWPGLRPGHCPIDRAPLRPEENIVEWAVKRTIAQDGAVLCPVHDAQRLDRHGGIGAIARF